MRILALIVIISMFVAACSINGSDNEPTPTTAIITSTPTEAASNATHEPTATPIPQTSATATPVSGAETPTISATSSATESAGTGGSQSDEAVRAEIEDIEQQVEDLRGLNLLDNIDEEIITRDELVAQIPDLVAEDYSPEEARVDALSYWLLRLIPDRNIDLYQLQIDLLGEQIAGYYDPTTKQLVVVTDEGKLTALDKVTMAHEIVHSLQDQHFDLTAIDKSATDADRDAAITALVEGDATIGMTEYLLNDLDQAELMAVLGDSLLGSQDYQVLDNAPRYIADSLTFSYEAGQQFADALHNRNGYDAINAAFNDLPASTEQIIHPEKYYGDERDMPMTVENPDLTSNLGQGWKMINSDVLGEFDFQIMLEENDAPKADQAAAGWGGSRFDIYESGDDSLSILNTVWDTDADSQEFLDAISGSFSSYDQQGDLWFDGERYFALSNSETGVVVISGTNQDAVRVALEAMGG